VFLKALEPNQKLSCYFKTVNVSEAWSYTFTPPVHLHGVVLN